MGYIKPFRLVLILGILLGHGVFAAESTARSEAAGAQWAAGWLSEIQRKYNPLPVALEGTDIDLIHPEKPRFMCVPGNTYYNSTFKLRYLIVTYI